jgi:Zn2+/Cd2+-exporting ATPase
VQYPISYEMHMTSYRPIKPTDDHANCEHDHAHDTEHSHHQEPVEEVCSDDGKCCAGATASAKIIDQTDAQEIPVGSIKTQLRIAQMDCPTEEALIRKKLGGMPEVSSLEFNLMQRILTVVHHNDSQLAVEDAIRSLGMTTEPVNKTSTSDANEGLQKSWWPLAVAGLAAIGAEILHWVNTPVWLVALFSLLAISLCGLGTYKKGWIALKNGNLNINALMSIAVTGALLIGQWPEAAMVMFLFTVAELIEAKSLDRARNAIKELVQLTPEQTTVQQADGSWLEVESKSVAIGNMVRIKPGERIALDGVIVTGQTSIDQAPITGESLPIEKIVGDNVFAATINQAGSFDYQVTAVASNSTLARIIHAIEEAQGNRAPTQRFVDQFAKVYTPIVFAIAVAVAILPPLFMGGSWFDWIYKALVLLVIACPCALVISTPVTIVSGLATAARHGILIKGGVYLEEGRKLKWLALDKTGTITHGKPVLTNLVLLEKVDGLDAVQIAASLAARSDHPISQAVAKAGKEKNIPLLEVDSFSAMLGRGVRGVVASVSYQLGNHRLIHELGVCSPQLEVQLEELEEEGKTVILLTDGQRVLVLFAVADTVKVSSLSAIKSLHALGIKTVMLTGDNSHTARAIATQVGIDEARGDQLPDDKLKAIESFAMTGKVGMVGDGINDAPALARADIGFAMGAAGTDTAIETADVALMDDDLGKIARFVQLSKSTHAVLIQNIVLALSIKVVFFILTIMGMGTMWMAVFADMGASLLVVANGLRLLRK